MKAVLEIYRTVRLFITWSAIESAPSSPSADSNSAGREYTYEHWYVRCSVSENRYLKFEVRFVSTRMLLIGVFCWLSRLHRLDFAEV